MSLIRRYSTLKVSGGSGYSPGDISGLTEWYDCADVTQVQDTLISSWDSRVGGFSLTQSTASYRPRGGTLIWQGSRCVRTGVTGTEWMDWSRVTDYIAPNAQRTLIWIGQLTTVTTASTAFCGTNSNAHSYWCCCQEQGHPKTWNKSQTLTLTEYIPTGLNLSINTPQMVAFASTSATQCSLSANASNWSVGAGWVGGHTYPYTSGSVLGSRFGTVIPVLGHTAALLMVNRVMTQTELRDLADFYEVP
jgi:hypothetical protein